MPDGAAGGAGLDVFENEPLIPPELLEMSNVAVTPHIGSKAVEARLAMARNRHRISLIFQRPPAFSCSESGSISMMELVI